ncbi:MAG: recombination regulator RecX, partial [Nitrospinota bacterium]
MRGRRVYELKSARERTPPRKEGLERQEARAMQAVYRLLGVRARSRRELERRLRQKGYPIDIV